MLNKIKSLFKRYFDYHIVGEYYDTDGMVIIIKNTKRNITGKELKNQNGN